MRAQNKPDSWKVRATLSVAKWAFIFFVGVEIFKKVMEHHAAYKLTEAIHDSASITANAAIEKAKIEEDTRVKERAIEAYKAANESSALAAKVELAREASRKAAEKTESIEREIRAYFASDDESGHRYRSESSFFTDEAMYFGEKFTSAKIDNDSRVYENTWPVHLVVVDGVDVRELADGRFDATAHLRVSRGMLKSTASPFFPVVHTFQGIRDGSSVKFTSIESPDVANCLVAKFTMLIGPQDIENSKRANFFDLHRKKIIPDDASLFKEIILMDRLNYYKGKEYRDSEDEPADWFLLDSTRKSDFRRFRKMPITWEPRKVSLIEGKTLLDVEVTNSRISVKVRD